MLFVSFSPSLSFSLLFVFLFIGVRVCLVVCSPVCRLCLSLYVLFPRSFFTFIYLWGASGLFCLSLFRSLCMFIYIYLHQSINTCSYLSIDLSTSFYLFISIIIHVVIYLSITSSIHLLSSQHKLLISRVFPSLSVSTLDTAHSLIPPWRTSLPLYALTWGSVAGISHVRGREVTLGSWGLADWVIYYLGTRREGRGEVQVVRKGSKIFRRKKMRGEKRNVGADLEELNI